MPFNLNEEFFLITERADAGSRIGSFLIGFKKPS